MNKQVSASGSLGGLHVVSLCERGPHARVVCAGRAAPPSHEPQPLHPPDDEKALLFTIERSVRASDDEEPPGESY